MAGDTVLRLRGVRKSFGAFTALAGIDLEITDGEFLTIVGPSGSGKTTLIRLLVGMEEPSAGEIHLRDRLINKVPANERPTCMVFQSLALFPHRTVGENIEFPMKLKGVSPDRRRERALELLALLHLPEAYYGKRVQACSGGEQQRVALARALAFDPEILFFDEPLSALDYRLRKVLEKELKDLHRRTGKTFVYITHSLEEAMVMSDRIAIMRGGAIVQVGTAEQIYTAPANAFVAEFMGEVNLFPVTGGDDGRLLCGDLEIRGHDERLRLASGGQGQLMVRPEFVRFLAPGEEADCRLQGRLANVFSLGSRLQYEIEAEGPRGERRLVTVEKLREERFAGAPNGPVTLGWRLADAHLIREA